MDTDEKASEPEHASNETEGKDASPGRAIPSSDQVSRDPANWDSTPPTSPVVSPPVVVPNRVTPFRSGKVYEQPESNHPHYKNCEVKQESEKRVIQWGHQHEGEEDTDSPCGYSIDDARIVDVRIVEDVEIVSENPSDDCSAYEFADAKNQGRGLGRGSHLGLAVRSV